MDENTLPKKTARLNEHKQYRLRCFDATNSDLSSSTAKIFVYDSSGTIVAGFTGGLAMTITGTKRCYLSYLITYGAGLLITVAGDYRVVIEHMLPDGQIRVLQGTLQVLGHPS